MAFRGLVFSLLELSCIIHFATGDRFIRPVEDVIILHSATAARKCAKHTHIFKESIPLLSSRTDLTKQTAIRSDHVHEVVFVVQQKRMDHITRLLHEVSDPASPNYGQHLSGEQISAITSNHEARDTIADFLNANGVLTMSETLSGDFITANAPISVWEKVFDTTFFLFTQRHLNGDLEEIVRAETYSIPRELDLHVESVLNTVELPVRTSRRLYRTSSTLADRRMRGLSTAPTGFLLPPDIRAYYNLTDVYGSEESTQSAVSFGPNYFSQSSLAYFQQYMSFQPLQPALNVGGFESDDPAFESTEGDLDIQYLMGISPTSPTTFWHASSGWVSWLTAVLNTPNPPLVHSISYGSDEQYTSLSTFNVMTTFAQKLGLMGVTLVSASGDDGVHSPDARNELTLCAYKPSFPGTNPYITTIGATSVSTYKRLTDR
jgi:tripeptidyl-peptidase I